MKMYRVEVTSYVNRRVRNMAVAINADNAVEASCKGVSEVCELTGMDVDDVTKIECEVQLGVG